MSGQWAAVAHELPAARARLPEHYEKVADRSAQVPPFTMDAEQYGGPVSWREVALSRTMLLSYGVLVAIDTMTVVFLA
ncbi:hypothetical protein [Streptomyces sp. NPDC055299]